MNKTIKILACAAILGSAILTGCEKNSLNTNLHCWYDIDKKVSKPQLQVLIGNSGVFKQL